MKNPSPAKNRDTDPAAAFFAHDRDKHWNQSELSALEIKELKRTLSALIIGG